MGKRTRQDSRLGPAGVPGNVRVCGRPGDRSTHDRTLAGARLGTVATSCSGQRLWALGVSRGLEAGGGGCSPLSVPSQAAGCRPCGLGCRGVYCVLTWRGAVAPQGARSVHGPAGSRLSHVSPTVDSGAFSLRRVCPLPATGLKCNLGFMGPTGSRIKDHEQHRVGAPAEKPQHHAPFPCVWLGSLDSTPRARLSPTPARLLPESRRGPRGPFLFPRPVPCHCGLVVRFLGFPTDRLCLACPPFARLLPLAWLLGGWSRAAPPCAGPSLPPSAAPGVEMPVWAVHLPTAVGSSSVWALPGAAAGRVCTRVRVDVARSAWVGRGGHPRLHRGP